MTNQRNLQEVSSKKKVHGTPNYVIVALLNASRPLSAVRAELSRVTSENQATDSIQKQKLVNSQGLLKIQYLEGAVPVSAGYLHSPV